LLNVHAPVLINVRDLRDGLTVLASINAAGTASANGRSSRPYLSADGRYVAFDSNASDLVPGDTNGLSDVFLRDMQTRQTTRVGLNGAGGAGQSDGDSYVAAMSADGRFIARTPPQIFSSGICRLTRRASSASTRGHLLSPPAK
jgi:Tol biopolymer transport system component